MTRKRRVRGVCPKLDSMAREALVALSVVLSAACGSPESADEEAPSEFSEELPEQLGQLEQPLYESNDIRTTAGAGMVDAYYETLADADLYEYCGLIVKVSATKFRASAPETSNQDQFCGASVSLVPGEVVVGYYHTHTAASDPGISDKDEAAARSYSPKREYFVLSTVTGCGEQYSPSTDVTTSLGCPF
jgi:hypothetical protein